MMSLGMWEPSLPEVRRAVVREKLLLMKPISWGRRSLDTWAQAELQPWGLDCCWVCLERGVKLAQAGGNLQPWKMSPQPLCGCMPVFAEVITVHQGLCLEPLSQYVGSRSHR